MVDKPDIDSRMKIVNFKRNFTSPDASRLRVANNPHRVPADWVLPKDAEVIGRVEVEPEAVKPAKPEPKQTSLKL